MDRLPLDLVTFGEAMIRFAAPIGEAVESTPRFDVRVGGAEANVAVILARMGFRTGWITSLVDDPLGRRIAGELRRHGVDISAVHWVPRGRTGLYFIEHAPAPRGVGVYYDRAGSACSLATPDDVDWEYVRKASWMHLTGITPALSDSCGRIIQRMLEEAKAAGIPVSFDVNHRRKLWDAARARAALEPSLRLADVIIVALDDARELWNLDGEAPAVAAHLKARWEPAAVVLTAGSSGAYLADGTGIVHQPGLPAGEVDPIGRGDALAAGLIWGALEGDMRAGLLYGAALAAFTQTYWGDHPWCTRADVIALLDAAESGSHTRPQR